ncbi:hypothetical protein BDN72DRAFT_883700, partial [Pluteus cervinus]
MQKSRLILEEVELKTGSQKESRRSEDVRKLKLLNPECLWTSRHSRVEVDDIQNLNVFPTEMPLWWSTCAIQSKDRNIISFAKDMDAHEDEVRSSILVLKVELRMLNLRVDRSGVSNGMDCVRMSMTRRYPAQVISPQPPPPPSTIHTMKMQSIAPSPIGQKTGLLDNLRGMRMYLHIGAITLLMPGGQHDLHPLCYLKIEEVQDTANKARYILKCQTTPSRKVSQTKFEWAIDQKLYIMASKISLKVMRSQSIISDQTILSIIIPVVDILTHLISSDSAFNIDVGPDCTVTMDIKKILDHLTLSGPLLEDLHSAQQSIDMILSTRSALGEFHSTIEIVSTLLLQLQFKLQSHIITSSQVGQLVQHIKRALSIIGQTLSFSQYSHDVQIALASVFHSL